MKKALTAIAFVAATFAGATSAGEPKTQEQLVESANQKARERTVETATEFAAKQAGKAAAEAIVAGAGRVVSVLGIALGSNELADGTITGSEQAKAEAEAVEAAAKARMQEAAELAARQTAVLNERAADRTLQNMSTGRDSKGRESEGRGGFRGSDGRDHDAGRASEMSGRDFGSIS